MRTFRSLRLAAVALLSLTAVAGAQSATQAGAAASPAVAAPLAPDVGQVAPDFTAQWADASGARSTPVSLAGLRGKVVVVAFYPRNRSSGCTAELIKFRDEHAKLFGSDVVVLPISADSVASHAAWASEMKFPFPLVSDPELRVADLYGSHAPGRAAASRTVFVIGKDGKVVWRELKFNALNEESYVALATAVAQAR
ncbi:MAG TPA: peroxiredoxin [Gemmatimonadaceae bacterium]|nr:peroxiredoxin [Gemmatimonadaceae bacterium]